MLRKVIGIILVTVGGLGIILLIFGGGPILPHIIGPTILAIAGILILMPKIKAKGLYTKEQK